MVFEGRLFRQSVGVLALLLAPALAWAEPTAADRETARGLMKQGTLARDAGHIDEALKNFEAADAIMRVPTTGYEVAKTRAVLGKLIEARDGALSIARSSAQPNEPPPFAEARLAAQKLSDDLEGRIPSVKITVKGATDPQISVDGSPLPKALVGLPRKLDPGKHTIGVKAPEGARSLVIEVFERESKEIAIDLGAPQPADPPSNKEKPLEITPPPDAGGKNTRSALPLALMIGGYGVGVAGGIISGVTGAISMSQASEIKKDCGGNICPPSERSKIDSANGLATVSTIALVAAGVGGAVGVVGTILFFSRSSKTAVRATIGVGSIGIEGRF